MAPLCPARSDSIKSWIPGASLLVVAERVLGAMERTHEDPAEVCVVGIADVDPKGATGPTAPLLEPATISGFATLWPLVVVPASVLGERTTCSCTDDLAGDSGVVGICPGACTAPTA